MDEEDIFDFFETFFFRGRSPAFKGKGLNTHSLSRTHAHTHTQTHAHTLTHTHAHKHARIHTHTHTHIHTHTYTHTHTLTRTHTHIQVAPPMLGRVQPLVTLQGNTHTHRDTPLVGLHLTRGVTDTLFPPLPSGMCVRVIVGGHVCVYIYIYIYIYICKYIC